MSQRLKDKEDEKETIKAKEYANDLRFNNTVRPAILSQMEHWTRKTKPAWKQPTKL
ncbi:hypothetical protein DPMN_083000 [Dreissena polymorpha]|uniref:Uncharacterized protein n=1 Tax=Dreissena polymorpha TaxID=45954 RepID=A0A9D3YBZ3_DREPO|nr:hypothetical protein DPMN_083000 [Dreissena polymorpha]